MPDRAAAACFIHRPKLHFPGSLSCSICIALSAGSGHTRKCTCTFELLVDAVSIRKQTDSERALTTTRKWIPRCCHRRQSTVQYVHALRAHHEIVRSGLRSKLTRRRLQSRPRLVLGNLETSAVNLTAANQWAR